MQIDGDNFLLPVDVVATSERTVRARSIDISEIVRDMEENADVTIVMLDAAATIRSPSNCSNPRRGRARPLRRAGLL